MAPLQNRQMGPGCAHRLIASFLHEEPGDDGEGDGDGSTRCSRRSRRWTAAGLSSRTRSSRCNALSMLGSCARALSALHTLPAACPRSSAACESSAACGTTSSLRWAPPRAGALPSSHAAPLSRASTARSRTCDCQSHGFPLRHVRRPVRRRSSTSAACGTASAIRWAPPRAGALPSSRVGRPALAREHRALLLV